MIILFIFWTMLIQTIDVQCVGETCTKVGFATMNVWFHELTGVHMQMYAITDWLGLVPIFVCFGFGIVGILQMMKRKSVRKVDFDIIALGVYYVIVILCYLFFEMVPINYRPILINGIAEASYPSSTTLLVLCVMPTLVLQMKRRVKNAKIEKVISMMTVLFIIFMVSGRLISGVHWITDIIGSILLSGGLYRVYKKIVERYDKK